MIGNRVTFTLSPKSPYVDCSWMEGPQVGRKTIEFSDFVKAIQESTPAPTISMILTVFPGSTAVKTGIGAWLETAGCLFHIVRPRDISRACSAVRRLVENAAMYGCPATRTNAGKMAVRSIHVEQERTDGSISRATSTARPLPSRRERSRAIPQVVCPTERFTYAHLGSMQSGTFPQPSVHFLWNAFWGNMTWIRSSRNSIPRHCGGCRIRSGL